MIIVTLNDLSDNGSKYFSLAKAGEKILLKAKDGFFRIMPFHDPDDQTDRFMKEMEAAFQEVKDDLSGVKPLKNIDSLWNEL